MILNLLGRVRLIFNPAVDLSGTRNQDYHTVRKVGAGVDTFVIAVGRLLYKIQDYFHEE
jgi:hypothetical protein